jgi:hypothetical protein
VVRFNSRTPSAFSSAWTFSLAASVETFRRRAAALNPPILAPINTPTALGGDRTNEGWILGQSASSTK